jgi:hypothetical protein
MATTSFTPSSWQVHNELDSLGLLLGTPRLEEERNMEYKQRLLDVFVHRSNSTYLGLIYGITRELGLNIAEVIRLQPVMNGEVSLGNNPAVLFENTKCYVYSDITDDENGLVETFDRFDVSKGAFTLTQLVEKINATGYFTAVLQNNINGNLRAMTIYDQASTILVPSESISGAGGIISLANQNLISNTIVISSLNLTERVSTSELLVKQNQYYIDTVNGILYTGSVPEPGSLIRYKYRDDDYYIKSSPVILHNLQSTDFKTKMFQQVLQLDGTTENSLPTVLGTELLNELFSVYNGFLGP